MKKKIIALFLTMSAALAACTNAKTAEESGGGNARPAPGREETKALDPAEGGETVSDSTDDPTDGVELTGEPLKPDQLVEFVLDDAWARSYADKRYAGDFLDSLDDPAFKDLYCRALALVRLLSTDHLEVSGAVDLSSPVFFDVPDEATQSIRRYMESGYTYESFYAAFCSVFTREAADTILSRYPFFYSYNGELWFMSTSAGGNTGEVFQEYELINQTDSVLEFKRISYSVAVGEPITDYDPAKKDEYEKEERRFRFVRTADGWRVEEFLSMGISETSF